MILRFVFIAGSAIASVTWFTACFGAAPPLPLQKPPSARELENRKAAGHFRGCVTGPDGKPLRGARVFIVPYRGTSKKAGPIRATTGADGRFAFDAPDMTYTELDGLVARRAGLLMVMADGFAPEWCHTSGLDGFGLRTHYRHWESLKAIDVHLQLARDDVPIQGRFLDSAGRPLAGARVRLDRLLVPWNRNLDAHLAVERKRSLYAMTSYEAGIDPAQLPGLTTETRTKADGRFTFTGLGRDRLVTLRVSAPTVVDTHLEVMTRNASDVHAGAGGKVERVTHGAAFTLQLKRGLTVKGVVRDRDTQMPIPGMWVTWRRDPLHEASDSADFPVTDAKGRFTITGLHPELWNWDKSYHVLTAFSRPGGQYIPADGRMKRGADVVIECVRGIGFRLKLVDEDGKPAEARVEYEYVNPNPHVKDLVTAFIGGCNWSIRNRAARRADGTYEGFVLPGPGAVLVTTPGRSYRPAHVDPKAFFAPGRTKWTPQERISTYGTHNTLQIGWNSWTDQHDYAAIVLVNPARNAAPLQLSATVFRDRPRCVSLIDPDGKPVKGVTTEGIIFGGWGAEYNLRTATFPLTKLHPDRARRITFLKADRRLIGSLIARGDGDKPYTVRMQPWGAVTGRLVDENGKRFTAAPPVWLHLRDYGFENNTDPHVGEYAHVKIDSDGRFRVDKMVPGQCYTAGINRNGGYVRAGMAFEKLVLRPGEVRDLGDIYLKPVADTKAEMKPGK
jgi:hypothetical protein